MKIEMEYTYDYRPCEVDGQKGIFHRWEDFQKPIDGGLTIGSHPAGQFSRVYGIVEFETGEVKRVEPFKIVFMDLVCEAIWNEYMTKDKTGGEDNEQIRIQGSER